MDIELNDTGEDSLCSRARQLLAAGAAARDEPANWVRAGIPVFTRTETLGWWADHDMNPGGTYGPARNLK